MKKNGSRKSRVRLPLRSITKRKRHLLLMFRYRYFQPEMFQMADLKFSFTDHFLSTLIIITVLRLYSKKIMVYGTLCRSLLSMPHIIS